MTLIQKYNKVVLLARYINVMNRRINAAPMPPDHLVEYGKSNRELLSIIKGWPEIIEENLRYVEGAEKINNPV